MIQYVVPLYAALLTFVYLALTARVIFYRKSHKISIGSKNQADLEVRIRAHGNFIEFTPFTLILIGILEYQQFGRFWIHCLCLLLLIGRIMHPIGLSEKPTNRDLFFRFYGMVLTLTSMATAAALIITMYVYDLFES